MWLVIETSHRAGSVARMRADGTIEAARPLVTPRDHAQGLAHTVQALFPEGFEGLEAYAVSVGPGSFTGLRIGVAFLKGLAAAFSRPVWGVSSLEVLAAGAECSSACIAAVDARRGNVFAGLYGPGLEPDPRLPDGMYSVEDLRARFAGDASITWTGNGAPLVDPAGAVTAEAAWVPQAAHLAARAFAASKVRGGVDPFEIAPVYHQLSAAEEAAGIQAVPG